MKIDKEIEYGTLRQEILDSITARDNYVIAMYTITTAILCLAFELQNPIIFLMPYIILFAFQNAIASKNENIILLAAYISIYLEEETGWESQNIGLKAIMHKGTPFRRPSSICGRLVGRIGSVQLGLLCSISSIIFATVGLLTAVSSLLEIMKCAICMLLSVIFYTLIRIQTKNVLELGKRRQAYIDNLREAKVKPRMEKKERGLEHI